jgi:hypothetical protein
MTRTSPNLLLIRKCGGHIPNTWEETFEHVLLVTTTLTGKMGMAIYRVNTPANIDHIKITRPMLPVGRDVKIDRIIGSTEALRVWE